MFIAGPFKTHQTRKSCSKQYIQGTCFIMCSTRDGHCTLLLMCVLVGEFVIETVEQGVVRLANREHGQIAVTDAKKVFVFVSLNVVVYILDSRHLVLAF